MTLNLLLHSLEAVLLGSSVLLSQDVAMLVFLSGASIVIAHLHAHLLSAEQGQYRYLVLVFLLGLLCLPLLLNRGLLENGLDILSFTIAWALSLFWVGFGEKEKFRFQEFILGIIPMTALLLVKHGENALYLNVLAVLSIVSSLWGRERVGYLVIFATLCSLEPGLIKYWPFAAVSVLGSVWSYRLGLFVLSSLSFLYLDFDFEQMIWPLESLIAISVGLSWVKVREQATLEKIDWAHFAVTFLLLTVPLAVHYKEELAKLEVITPTSAISVGTIILIIILKTVTKKDWYIRSMGSPWEAQFLTSKLAEEKKYFIYRDDPLERILGYELLNKYRKLVDNVDMQFTLWFLLIALSMGGMVFWL